MKKILALVLAVAMMATLSVSAFAINDGDGVGITSANPGDTLCLPGDEFVTKPSVGSGVAPASDWHFSSEYFTLSSKSFTKGANLVKSVALNDDDNVVEIALNDNYELMAPNGGLGQNLVIKKIAVKGRSNYDANKDDDYTDIGDIKKGTEYVYDITKGESLSVGFPNTETDMNGDVEYVNGDLVKFKKGTDSYATASLSDQADVYIEGRVYDKDKVYVKVDNKADTDVLKAAPDDADIRFYNITTNGFPSANTIQLTVEEDQFVYKYVDGRLTASGLKWSADDYAWVGKIRSTTKYVVSDVELKSVVAAGDPAETPNPDTGANDVVGIAAALAIVSLVAAGAVSLKK